MPKCSVLDCKNTSCNVNYTKNGISFHAFPNDPKTKEIWINATGRGPSWFPAKNSTICSSHFDPKCFIPLKNVRRLFEESVPTLKLRMTWVGNEACTSKDSTILQAVNQTNDVTCSHVDEEMASLAVGEKDCNAKNEDPSGTIPSQVAETPRNLKLRRVIAVQEKVIRNQKTKIKSLQKRTSRYKKKIADLKNILENLKDKISRMI